MIGLSRQAIKYITVISSAYGIAIGGAAAADLSLPTTRVGGCDVITLVCENASRYQLCPIATTDSGEIVTASLGVRGPLHVRLVPTGIGYRYAGRGVWFDGQGFQGRLNFGMKGSVACDVAYAQ